MPDHMREEIARQIRNIDDHYQDRMDPEVQEEFLFHHAPDLKYLLSKILLEIERNQKQAA